MAAAGLAVMVLCGGCRATYLARLAYEEARYLGGAKPVTEILATTQDPKRRRALEAVLEAREFAAREGLDVGGSYREIADMGSASPFQVVTAARADRLEPYTWWYPVIGAIPYRGYFDRASAEAFAAGLHAEGLDTMIVEASAYSTLGWFDDPLPSSVVERGEGAVVLTVLHELTHQTFFAPGEVAFNETLATAVAWRLAQRFYAARGNDEMAARMERGREAWVARSDVLDAAAVRLREYYDRAKEERRSHEEMMAGRATLYADILAGIAKADPDFAAGLVRDGLENAGLDHAGLDNASFLATHRYATGGREIDSFLASQPSIAAALGRLAAGLARHEDLRTVVAATATTPSAPQGA